jgi:hypothetical protein
MDGEQPEAPRRNGDAGATPAGPREPTAGGSGRMPEPTRRGFLAAAGLGAGTLAVIGAGGLTWRAVSQGVFATGTGPAYAAWDQWTPPGHAPLNLIRAAVLAASAHNTQPWLFAITPARIDLFAVPSRNIGTVDPLRREMQISLGCALENLVLAGPPHGLAPAVTLMPDPADQTHVARVDLAPAPATTPALFRAIPYRHTNRAAYDTSRPLPAGTLSTLTGLVNNPDGNVVWLISAADKRAFGDLTVRATQAIIADPQQSADDYRWWRGDWSAIQTSKDGLTSDASVSSPLIGALAKLLPASHGLYNSSWLTSTRDTQVPTAAAFGILVVRDPLDPAQRLLTGRAWQRMHLWATTQGLAMQPLNQAEERMDRERTAGLTPTFTTAMAGILPTGWHPVFSFRIGYPTTTASPSPRIPADAVVH